MQVMVTVTKSGQTVDDLPVQPPIVTCLMSPARIVFCNVMFASFSDFVNPSCAGLTSFPLSL